MRGNYTGKGNPLTYWYNTGVHFGFPECCIEAFLEEDYDFPPTSFDGTGYRPCKLCSEKEPEELIKYINANRKHPKPFPDDSGFVGHFRETMHHENPSS